MLLSYPPLPPRGTVAGLPKAERFAEMLVLNNPLPVPPLIVPPHTAHATTTAILSHHSLMDTRSTDDAPVRAAAPRRVEVRS